MGRRCHNPHTGRSCMMPPHGIVLPQKIQKLLTMQGTFVISTPRMERMLRKILPSVLRRLRHSQRKVNQERNFKYFQISCWACFSYRILLGMICNCRRTSFKKYEKDFHSGIPPKLMRKVACPPATKKRTSTMKMAKKDGGERRMSSQMMRRKSESAMERVCTLLYPNYSEP